MTELDVKPDHSDLRDLNIILISPFQIRKNAKSNEGGQKKKIEKKNIEHRF